MDHFYINDNRVDQLLTSEKFFEQAEVLKSQQRYAEAIALYETTLRNNPQHAGAYNAVGNILSGARMFEKAIVHFEKALALAPGRHEIVHNLAHAHYSLGRFQEAVELYRQALSIAPGFYHSRVGLGCALQTLGYFDEAMACYVAVPKDDAAFIDAQWNRFLGLLLNGDYLEGWPQYEWRYNVLPEFATRRFTAPMWQGENLAGKRILVMAEQGAGDTYQFLRYLPVIKALNPSQLIFACQKELKTVLGQIECTDSTVTQEAIIDVAYDYYVYLMSLPALCKTTPQSIPPSYNPIQIPTNLQQQWQNRLHNAATERFLKIGITWSGNTLLQYNIYRACPSSFFEPLFSLPGTRWFSLQKINQTEAVPDEMLVPRGIVDLGPDITDWQQTAAAVSCLDLIITVDTGVAHLSATLGKPTWVILPYCADWRWFRDRDDTPWYPDNVRLFRQKAYGDWQSVFEALKDALAAERVQMQPDDAL